MTTGTKSLLFGVHQVLWHPITVLLAWIHLYGLPNWKELVCIIIHDWGYWGKAKMDDAEGETHPRWAAHKAMKWFGVEYFVLCLYHSRHYAKRHNKEPSRLCWADKLSFLYDPWWFYLPRAWLSGELTEYREMAEKRGDCGNRKTAREWHKHMRNVMWMLAIQKKGDATPYNKQEGI